jgi:hypothetical protein
MFLLAGRNAPSSLQEISDPHYSYSFRISQAGLGTLFVFEAVGALKDMDIIILS